MRQLFRSSVLIRFFVLINVILFTISSKGQQTGSAPTINIISPTAGDSLNNSGLIILKAEITSASPIKTYRVFNGREVVKSETGKNLKIKDGTTYIIETSLQLTKGENIIYLEVKNDFSTTVSAKHQILSQNEPFIRWVMPSGSTTNIKSSDFTVKAEIRTLLPVQNLSISLNGINLTQDKVNIKSIGNNTFIFENTFSLRQGKNTISIACGNARGSTTSIPRYIVNSYSGAPYVKLISPALADSLNTTGLTTVKATIESKTPLKSFRLIRNDEVIVSESGKKLERSDSSTYILETYVDLKKGFNVLYLEVSNSSGTASSEKLRINSRNEPFVTWLMPNTENSNVESENITLRAEIKSGTPLKRTIINVNGVPITDDKANVTPPEKDTYSLEKSIQLKSGKNTIYITSLNTKGEKKSLIRYVNCTAGATPVITLVSPQLADSVNISGLITVNAEIVSKFDLQAFRIFNGRNAVVSQDASNLEKKDSITYIVKSFVPLQAGSNTIFLEARNSAGLGTSARRIITCKLEPIITWILPSSVTSNFDAGNMTIKAEISSGFDLSGVKVTVNGNTTVINKEALKRINNLTWVLETPVTLLTGTNTITLAADNVRVSGKSAIRQVNYIPGVRPEINWISPTALNSETEMAEFQLSASIKAKSQVKTAKLFINGTELTAGDKQKINQKNAQEYVYENSIPLRPGENKIKLSASTGPETVFSEERVITYNAPVLPELSWKSPTPDNSEVSRPSIDLKMLIRSKAALKSLSVYLNGKVIDNINLQNSIRKENDYFVLENAIPIGPGENSIYITASNNAGLTRSDTRNIKYVVQPEPVIASSVAAVTVAENNKQKEVEIKDEKVADTKQVVNIAPLPPVVSWVSPSGEKNDITESSPRIRVRINSSAKMQSVLLYVNGVASETVNELRSSANESEYLLERAINLNPGENTIYLVATNAGGAKKSDLRYITNPPTTPPMVTWSYPKDQKTISDNEMLVIEACINSATELKSVQVMANGNSLGSLRFFDPPRPGDCNYTFTFPVPLREGENTLYIYAENFAGTRPSESRIIRFEKAFIAEKRIALLFGNADYGSSGSLKNPVNDANLMEATLKSLSFDVIKRINATQDEMKNAIKEFRDKLPEYNVALFYYAGHGVQVGDQHYLIPTDAKLDKQTDCEFEAVEVELIQRQLQSIPDNTNIIILDACRDNPFKSWSRGSPQGFRALNPTSGTFISFATKAGSVAADGTGKNGTFTEELVKQMVIPQSIFTVFINTRKEVMRRTNGIQQPQEWNMLTGDFYFKK